MFPTKGVLFFIPTLPAAVTVIQNLLNPSSFPLFPSLPENPTALSLPTVLSGMERTAMPPHDERPDGAPDPSEESASAPPTSAHEAKTSTHGIDLLYLYAW